MNRPFFTLRARMMRLLWRLMWLVLTPMVAVYCWHRGRKDPRYRDHISERFGSGPTLPPGAVWIHAVSLGEVRSAVPLVRALLAQGDRVAFTHGTPAGRAEVAKVFGPELADGMVSSRYLPLEQGWAFRRFFRRVRPRIGLVMEVEFWPVMVTSARRHGVPIYLCNGQYPGKSFAKDRWFRKSIPSGFSGVMVKSKMMADRFQSIGCPWIAITGELRFEQPIPADQIIAGQTIANRFRRPVITLSSVVDGEDDLFMDAIRHTRGPDAPLFIYVPRAPERFDAVGDMLTNAGFRVQRRTDVLTGDLKALADFDPDADVLLGDSLGEMYFYLTLADQVIVGGGFTPKASHNIIESLAVGKPVAVGPNIHTIEYPGVEAIDAGVCTHLQTADDLTALCGSVTRKTAVDPAVAAFLKQHGGAVAKTIKAIERFTSR